MYVQQNTLCRTFYDYPVLMVVFITHMYKLLVLTGMLNLKLMQEVLCESISEEVRMASPPFRLGLASM